MRTASAKQELVDLCKYINTIHDTSNMLLVEIGTFYGDSTVIFANYFGKVITIDPFQNNLGDISNSVNMPALYEMTKKRLSTFHNVQLIRGFSEEVAKQIAGCDACYVDGMHTYKAVKNDLRVWAPKTKYFVMGHDYRKKFHGVVKAVNEYKKPDKVFKDYSFVIKNYKIVDKKGK
jgi:cephalosporin hydroxylase